MRRGEAPDDFIDPRTLNPLARSYLREAFRAVASVQSGLAAELSLGVRWERRTGPGRRRPRPGRGS